MPFASYIPDVVIVSTPDISDGPLAVNVPEEIVKLPSTSVFPETVHSLVKSLKLPLETVKSPLISRFDWTVFIPIDVKLKKLFPECVLIVLLLRRWWYYCY